MSYVFMISNLMMINTFFQESNLNLNKTFCCNSFFSKYQKTHIKKTTSELPEKYLNDTFFYVQGSRISLPMVGFPRGRKGGPSNPPNAFNCAFCYIYDYIQNFEVVGYAYANMLKDRRAYDNTVETSVYVRFEPPITIQLLYNVSDQFGFVITIGLERDLRQYKSSTKKLLGSYQSHFSNWSIMKCG